MKLTSLASDTTPQQVRYIRTALFVLGFTCILAQIVIIREFLNVFQGNELIIGLILCVWMLLTAAGSKFGQVAFKHPGSPNTIRWLLLLAGTLPMVTVILLYLLEVLIFPTGTAKGPLTTVLFCFLLLMPFCIVSGMLFTMLASFLSTLSGTNRISKAYSWESAGGMTAGILFSLCFAYLFSGFQVLAFPAAGNALIYFMLCLKLRSEWLSYVAPVILLALSVVMIISPVDRWAKSTHFIGQDLAYTKDTPYGNISVTHTSGQYNYYENGTLIFSTQNSIVNEEAIHFALLQHQKPENILVVSGGITGMMPQVFKYSTVRNADYLELNPWLVKAEKLFSDSLTIPALHVITKDARLWIKNSSPVYDAIIVNTPDPCNAQINRYYTLEFFREAKQTLRPGGIFSISLSPAVNYMTTEAEEINSILYHTLKKVFDNVETIPGERNYFIASDNTLRIDIAQAVHEAEINTEYVNPYYIDDELLRQKNQLIMNEITSAGVEINTDLAPLAYFVQIRYWSGIFKNPVLMLVLILLLILTLVIPVLRKMSPVGAGIFAGGFAGAASEFLVLIVFQILYGYVYQMLGVIVAFYMAGLTAGSALTINTQRSKTIRSYILAQIIIIIILVLFPLITMFVAGQYTMPGWAGQVFLFITISSIAFTSGLEFNLASRLEQNSIETTAGSLYGIDLAGAAIGTLIVSFICFPLLGLWYSCLIIAGVLFSGLAIMVLFRGKYQSG